MLVRGDHVFVQLIFEFFVQLVFKFVQFVEFVLEFQLFEFQLVQLQQFVVEQLLVQLVVQFFVLVEQQFVLGR